MYFFIYLIFLYYLCIIDAFSPYNIIFLLLLSIIVEIVHVVVINGLIKKIHWFSFSS